MKTRAPANASAHASMSSTTHIAKPQLSATKARGTAKVAQEYTNSHPKGAAPITKPFKPLQPTSIPAPIRRSTIEQAPSMIGGRPYKPKD